MAEQQIHTYVFTDLVGSTRLTRTLPAPIWRRAKDRHDALVRERAAAAGGQVVKALGDGFLVVFLTEEPALEFAIALQRAMLSEPWPDQLQPEIRIGMDSGPALYRSDPPDYEGDAVNVASHICARARPGEVLLSARAYFGAHPSLERFEGQIRLEPIGEVRLKGLPTPERLYRAWAPGLRDGYPPLVRVGNLAAYLGPPPFIGREAILEEVVVALRRSPVVTLLGPGGIGKTRLALETGARLETDFPAGVWVAPLESARRAEQMTAELIATLGLKADDPVNGSASPDQILHRYLEDWHGLLILDNLEQLVEADGAGLTQLLTRLVQRRGPARLLCTSRLDLHLGGAVEARIELPPLPAPGSRPKLAELWACPSALLCVERLRLRARSFLLNGSSAPHVAAICRATEGVPLLIELAAGQLGRRTLPEIARDVERALVTPSRDRDRPDRHRDLTRLIDWSLALLGEEREFFLRLGVFHGSFTAEAAAAVADEPRAEELLQELVEAHLVVDPAVEDLLAEEPRYRLLSATAAYSRTQLGDSLAHWRQRHAVYYGEVARQAEPELWGTAPRTAFAQLRRERENLAAALGTALDANDGDLAAAIGGPLWELYHRLGLWPLIRDGARRLYEAATNTSERRPRAGAAAAMALAQASHDQGRMAEAREWYEKALAVWRELGDEAGAARALHGLGNALRRQDPDAAEQAYQESLQRATRTRDEPLRALNLTALGLVASGQGRLEEAEGRHAEAVRLFRRWDDPWGLAIALNCRAQNLDRLGLSLQALDLYRESLAIKRELEDRRGMAMTLAALARLLPAGGEPAHAEALLQESLSLNRELGDAWGCAITLGMLAERWLAKGSAAAALEATATARAALDELGGGSSSDARQLDTLLQSARARLPTSEADALERRGRETPLIRACEAALEVTSDE